MSEKKQPMRFLRFPAMGTTVTVVHAKWDKWQLITGNAKYYWVNVEDWVDFLFTDSGKLKKIDDYHYNAKYYKESDLKWAITDKEWRYARAYQKAQESLKQFKEKEKKKER